MTREIKFRGKRVDTKEWVYGYYFISPLTDENSGAPVGCGWCFLADGIIRHCISTPGGSVYVVLPETVEHYTGMLDKAKEVKIGIFIGLYLLAIVAANFSVLYFGKFATPINAFFLIGFDLTMRDKLHDTWEGKGLWLKMALLITMGSLITYLLNANAAGIALASVVAFMGAGVSDAVTYWALNKKSFLIRSNGSNVVSSLIDSVLFPTIAFGTVFPLIIIGQFLAKISGGFLWSLAIKRLKFIAE